MAVKEFVLPVIGPVTVYKRRSARSIRLSVDGTGKIRISMPTWAPYRAGLEYARSKQDWLLQQVSQRTPALLTDGQLVGKHHELHFVQKGKTIRSRLTASSVTITHPVGASAATLAVQDVAKRACIRALRSEAEELLPERLRQVAKLHDFSFRTVEIKRLRGRWGSCDRHQHIILNLFMMQLPWQLIDYVLLHELVHTQHLHHGSDFWQRFNQALPNAKSYQKLLRNYQPQLGLPANDTDVA
jgi:predicted metal-dependent hydrolase